MTKRLIKTRKQHRQLSAGIAENVVAQTLDPVAGALTAGENGTVYAGVTFSLSAPVGASSFVVSAGALPDGLALVGNSLEGTPTVTDDFAFSITGTDQFGNSVTNAYTLSVTDPV